MDEHRIQYVISDWHVTVGSLGLFYPPVATPSIVIDHSGVFTHFLLLVSIPRDSSDRPELKTGILFSFLNESPRWLISKGREQDAYKILFKKELDFPEKEKLKSKALQEKV